MVPVADLTIGWSWKASRYAIATVLLLACASMTGKGVSVEKLRNMSPSDLKETCDKARERSYDDCYTQSGGAATACENNRRANQETVLNCSLVEGSSYTGYHEEDSNY